MRFINNEFSRFVVIGIINTAATYMLYIGLLWFVPYVVAYSVSFVAGVLFSYYLLVKIVFRASVGWRSALKYPVVYVVQYVLGIALLYLLVEKWGIRKEAAPLLIVAVSTPVTFFLSRLIILSGQSGRNG